MILAKNDDKVTAIEIPQLEETLSEKAQSRRSFLKKTGKAVRSPASLKKDLTSFCRRQSSQFIVITHRAAIRNIGFPVFDLISIHTGNSLNHIRHNILVVSM
jgi:hypothetical protein